MCNNRFFDIIAVVLSVLVGAVLTVLGFLALLVTGPLIAALGGGFGLFALLLLVIAASSLLRQSAQYNACMGPRALRVLISAASLVAVAGLSLILLTPAAAVTLILNFLIFALFTYTLLAVCCMLSCIAMSGCERERR